MDFEFDHLSVPSYTGRDRYLRFDITGITLQHGHIQRPSAEQKARYEGYGLVDLREKKILVQPDYGKRVERLEGAAEFHACKAQAARDSLKIAEQIKDAVS